MEPPYFTVSACHRCRKRKTRCDARLPACLPCQKVGSRCEYNDVQTKVLCSRDFICSLEAEVESLERELRHLQNVGHAASTNQVNESREGLGEGDFSNPFPEAAQAPRADQALDSLDEGPNRRYLGVSSGMHLARSVLNSARLNDPLIDQVPPDPQHSQTEAVAFEEPTTPGTSDTKPTFPSEEVALSLVEIFLDQYQLQYPIVSQEWLVREIQDLYHHRSDLGATVPEDTCTAFMFQMIFAISLLSISQDNHDDDALNLAHGFYASAMSSLTKVMERKGLGALQCLLLLLLYSLLHFSETPIWHISGLSVRMCIDLGLHSEATIKASCGGVPSEMEIDSKRRLFWATYTLDRTLSIMLGRPFTLEDRFIDVAYPELSVPEEKRTGTIHWIKLQRLQSIAVSRYDTALDERSIVQWMHTNNLENDLAAWSDEAPLLADSSRYTIDWWRYWYHNTLLILYRPSSNIPSPDLGSLRTCYAAAKNVIEAAFVRLHTGRLDSICVDIHYQFMAGITLLFLVWNSTEIRKQAMEEWTSFKSCLVQWELVLEKMTTRWDRADRAKAVVHKLSSVTVDIAEGEIAQASKRQGMIHTDGRAMRAREQERVKLIMQQLCSPGMERSHAPQTTATLVGDELPGAAGDREAVTPLGDDTHSHDVPMGHGTYEESGYHQQQQTYNYPDPIPPSSFPNEPTLADDTSLNPQAQSWHEAEFAQLSQMLRGAFDAPALPFPTDLSAIFGDSLWSSNQGTSEEHHIPDDTDAPGLFSNFVAGLGDNMWDSWHDNGGRARNMAWADSVLNFPEEWEAN
ncbi:fungal-specific transcription factor domain-containing protein [Aspergillus insuetus]